MRAFLVGAAVAWAAAGCGGTPGGGAQDLGPCVPDPADCAQKCGMVTDRCGFAVNCGPCGNGGSGGTGGTGGVGGTGGTGGSGGTGGIGGTGGSGGTGGVGGTGGGGGGGGVNCNDSSAEQCFCSNSSFSGSASSCTGSQFGTGVCCATADYPSGTNSSCFCETWGCSAPDTTGGSCTCGLGFSASTTCSPGAGAICCETTAYPSCTCSIGLAACAPGSTQVSSCTHATFDCGSGYTYPQTVSSCK